LSGLYDFTRARQLKHDGVGLRLIAGPRGAHAKLEISVGQYLLRFESIFTDHVRHFHFRTAQRKIHSRRHSEEKNNRNRDNDGDTSEY
jgi:hypothetical protein